MSSKLIRGTFILTLGTIISKFIGLFYVIPFYQIIGGSEPAALYQYGYVPYTIFLSVATAGVPLAVSKFIAKYNALEEYAVGRKLFKSGLFLMIITGIISFLLMFWFAPVFAKMTIPAKEQVYSIADVTIVIRAVSFALIIIPFMSLIRGFFQGHQSMGPSAVSQVVEQIVRIVFLLGGVYVVLNMMHGSIITAISVATFAAFIGGIASLAVLGWYWVKRKPNLDKLLLKDKGTLNISLFSMYKEIILYSIPFVLVGIINPLYQLVDQITFNRAMDEIGKAAQSDLAFSILNFSSQKIVIIPVSLATAFAMTLVPLITSSFVSDKPQELKRQLDQTFQVLLFLTIPAALGISLLAEPAYSFFYGHSGFGTEVLRAYAPVAILFALYAVTAAILQGINEQRFTMLSLLVGLLIKLSLNIPLIKWMETEGAILATSLGYVASIVINIGVIRHFTNYSFKKVSRKILLMVGFNLVMGAVVVSVYFLLRLFLNDENRIQALLIVLICGGIGGATYFYLSLRSGLAVSVFGERANKWRKRIRA